jgi:uncharacterized damage-inducible protein DinB
VHPDHPYYRRYVVSGLKSAPATLQHLLRNAPAEALDRRPDPDRFTIREVVAHLADWDAVWMERFTKLIHEENPFLPGYDEGRLAIEHDYANSSVEEQLARLAAGREELTTLLQNLSPTQWQRSGTHAEWKHITVETLAVLVLGHDSHHVLQVVQWLQS